MRSIFGVIIFSILSICTLQGQDVEFTGSAPKVVSVGEQFRLIFTLNQKDDQFIPPDLSNFQILIGPNTSYSSSTSIINGKMTQKVSYTYTYILQATDIGNFEIPSASALIDKKTYHSNPLRIEVVQGAAPSSSGGDEDPGVTTQAVVRNEDLFVRLLLNKSQVYQGDYVIATIKVYSRVNLSGFEDVKFPNFEDFLKEDIETAPLRSLERENVNGQIYGTGVLARMVLYPQKNGTLTIAPVQIQALIQQRVARTSRSIFDDFFDSFQTVRKDIKSPVVTVEVKPLPPGAPNGFGGAVGKMDLAASIDKNEVDANEAITLRVQISGNGNLKLVSPPQVDFPMDFETYDPKISSNLTSSTSGTEGSKTFEYLMIPRFAGEYRIPSIQFHYFDPDKQVYQTTSTQPFQITVNKSDQEAATIVTTPSKEDIQFIGRDIRFIHSGAIDLKPMGIMVWGSIWFILVYVLSLGLFLIVFFLRRKKIRERSNLELLKNRKASKFARKRLKHAAVELKAGHHEGFYKAVLSALWGYFSDKLGIPVSGLSRDTIATGLKKFKVEEPQVQDLMTLIDQCEFAQYAPASTSAELEGVYKETVQMITKLEQKLK